MEGSERGSMAEKGGHGIRRPAPIRGFGPLLVGITFALAFSIACLGADATLAVVGDSPPPFRSDFAIFSYGNLVGLLFLVPAALFLFFGYYSLSSEDCTGARSLTRRLSAHPDDGSGRFC